MKYLILNNKRKIKSIINYLVNNGGLPQIQRRLNVFAEDDTFQIEILNNESDNLLFHYFTVCSQGTFI